MSVNFNFQEIPIIVTYYTNSKILCQKEFGSFAHFGSILNYFERYLKQSDKLQLKPKYILDDRKIENTDLLMNLIQIPEKSKKIINANLLIEIEEKSNIIEKNYPCLTKILQPKLNPFGLYILNPKEGSLSSKQFPDQIGVDKEKENENELNKININSAYCNSNKDLFISGGIYSNNEINNFWIINNESFTIKNIHMPFNKSDHSMIYINHNDEEFVFIAGGNDLKTFYYDIKSKRFSKWGNMNYAHIRPALIYIDNYIYCFDTSSNKNEITFERTNLDDISHKWEKIVPIYENEKNKNLVNKGFGVVTCGGGKVMLCGGDIINMNPYLYDINKNLLYTNDNYDDILFTFSDKNFYKINNNSYIALPSSLDEENEILIVDKNKYTLNKININSKEGKSKLKNIDDNIHKIKDSLFGNVHIELKTKDIIPEKINKKEIENQKDNNKNDIFNDDNISYFESKPKEKNQKNKIFDEIYENNFENKLEDNKYILNNHNFTNYKKERNMENDYNYNDIDNNNSFEDDFEEEKKYKCKKKIEIKLNYDDAEGIYEVEGNNFIFDSNQKKFNDIKNNNEKFNIKNPQKNNDYNNNIINNVEEDKNEKNLDNKKDENFVELEGKEDDKDENDQINIIEEDNNNPKNNNLDYSEEKIEESNEKEESNENNNLNNNDNDGDDNNKEKDIKEKNEQNNDEPKEEHLEKNEEQNPNEVQIDQNEVNNVQKEGEENDKNDEKNSDQPNIEKNDDQDIEHDNEQNNEQKSDQYNEENIEGNALDEEKQINNNEEIENYEGEKISENNGVSIENGDANLNQGENGDIEENKDEIEQNNYIEHEENNVEENNEENNNGEEHEENEEQQDYYEPQERDKFQQTIVQPIGEDIIQIDNNPSHFYYDENNFCDYDIKHNDIEF